MIDRRGERNRDTKGHIDRRRGRRKQEIGKKRK